MAAPTDYTTQHTADLLQRVPADARGSTLSTVERSGRVLELFASGVPEWGPTAVAEALDLPKSRAHALLTSLASIGLLTKTPSGRYRLGWLTLSLSASVTQSSQLWALSAPVMHSLSQRLGETLNLAVLDRSYVVMVGRKAGRLPIPVTENYAGSRPAAHATAAGKLLLAFSETQVVEDVLARDGMPGYTLDTIDDRDALFRELDQVREEGVARDRGEFEPEIECLASPIHDPLGNVAGVLALSATRERFARDAIEYTAALRSATREISGRWLRV